MPTEISLHSDDLGEGRFLAEYDPRAFPPVAVTVDVVILTIHDGQLWVLLVRRGVHPYRDRWALPGGFVRPGEDLLSAAVRELAEEAGVRSDIHLEQLGTYGEPDRDPRMRVISVAYVAMVPNLAQPCFGTDAADARLWPVRQIRAAPRPALAFDHDQILADGVERACAKLEYTNLATSFLQHPFTIADLRRVYEAVWERALHAANFRRKVLNTAGFVVATGARQATGRGWADLYRPGGTTLLHPALLRPSKD